MKRTGFLPGISQDLSPTLRGSENVLVHVYWDLDLVQVYAILQRDLPVLQEFLAEMKTFARARYDRGDA